ncbi:MAG: NAD(P)-binding protein [Acidimicrobiales bacterium]
MRARIGVIGGGAAGVAATWLLGADHDATLFEAEDHLGGHAACGQPTSTATRARSPLASRSRRGCRLRRLASAP